MVKLPSHRNVGDIFDPKRLPRQSEVLKLNAASDWTARLCLGNGSGMLQEEILVR